MFPLYVCTVIGLFVTAHSALLERTELKEEPALSGIGPQIETKPDCTHKTESDYVYQRCEYTCEGDEAIFLDQRQPCYLRSKESAPDGPSVVQRAMPHGARGVCVNGECIADPGSPKGPAPQPEPVPESEPQPQSVPEPPQGPQPQADPAPQPQS